MTPDEMREIILSFRGAEEGVSYGAPAYKVNGKFFTRLRREDQSVVLTGISMDEREMLMEAEPATFHITPHYKDYPSVLARIESLHPGSFRSFLERKWRQIAPKKWVKEFDAART
ncbi:MAG: MmcQ/YjbR family DNA-binding protein [Phenylobacterium sp.]|uniref:MmcQ/YjbR family DNA-binding protein n=1 Tax=Phenylobacterium sp. TaxID=1871053 RepID=UPI001B5FD18B|nr:MmcQ/YjbR family DNA-binding protein [Phenylobacterium sp.]MBP7649874.1 MmcQ/YjbR family DNA-binding protein [Phenylobacterium sp.]MBP7817905.1 MmcQ/YjbR family DNA-binding protein [Phenylobacterium sp.]MBP9232335.1 MmcQ/YjbR family DNA-binding protein [Phenylobacterium sp.]MBP9756378.1 MmcQ/YjbR family DNA-binding protein [Phenylobacterium sp.]